MVPEENGFSKCSNCGDYKKENIISKQKINKKIIQQIEVCEETNIFADYDFICGKCGYTKAQIIDRGPMYSDEDTILILKCGKCGYSEHQTKKRK